MTAAIFVLAVIYGFGTILTLVAGMALTFVCFCGKEAGGGNEVKCGKKDVGRGWYEGGGKEMGLRQEVGRRWNEGRTWMKEVVLRQEVG